MTPNELPDRFWQLAARVTPVVNALPDTRSGRYVAGQLIRCATAAPPNYDEGRVAEGRADCARKVNVALKELVETEVGLKFIVMADLLPAKRQPRLRKSAVSSGISTSRLGPPTADASRGPTLRTLNRNCSIRIAQ